MDAVPERSPAELVGWLVDIFGCKRRETKTAHRLAGQAERPFVSRLRLSVIEP